MEKLSKEEIIELLKETVFVANCFRRAFEGKRVTNIPHCSCALERIEKLLNELKNFSTKEMKKMLDKKWNVVLDASDLWKNYEDEKITIAELSKEFAKRLSLTVYAKDLEELIEHFENATDADTFDYYLEELYDFCDDDKRMFIKTY